MYWTNIEEVGDLPDWSGVALTINEDTQRETLERVLDDPRILQLAGLKIIGLDWKHGIPQMILDQSSKLPALEFLSVVDAKEEEEDIPLQEWLGRFPGLDELQIEGCTGVIEPCRHLCLRSLTVDTYLYPWPEYDEYNSKHIYKFIPQPDLYKLEALCDSVYPALEELSLGFEGFGLVPGEHLIDRILPSILQGESFPNLKLLRLLHTEREDLAHHLIDTLVAQNCLAPKLESIYFEYGPIEDRRWGRPNRPDPQWISAQEKLNAWKFVKLLSIKRSLP